MILNHITLAFRTLRRNSEYALINIIGLAISIASCLLLFAVLSFETSFDSYHRNIKELYRFTMTYKYEGGEANTPGVPGPAPEAFRTDFPQLTHQATLFNIPNMSVMVTNDAKSTQYFKEEKGASYVEPEFFEMFDFKWLHGAPSSLSEPNSVVLDEATAAKYFGTWQDAIGKSITIDEKELAKVTGIVATTPPNTDLPMHVSVSFKTRKETDMDWGNVTSRRQHYVQLPAGMTGQQLAALLPAFKSKHIADTSNPGQFNLQPVSSIHYDERFSNLNSRTISKTTLVSFGIIAVFLLLTSSINFINLAIAQVVRKAKEVGIRKVLGSVRHQLIAQFLGETFVILLIAAVISIVIAEAVLPALQPVLYLPVNFSVFKSIDAILFLAGIIVVLTVLAGAYPAFVMSGFKPVVALKSRISTSSIGGVSLRKGLVVVQFIIAQVLVIVTIVVTMQMNFFSTTPKGFNSDAVINIQLPKETTSLSAIEGFKNTILTLPGVVSTSASYTPPSSRSNNTTSFSYEGATKTEPFEVNLKFADADYFKTYHLSLIAGRIYQHADTAREVVVNERFLKKLGVASPTDILGKSLNINGKTLPVVGVVRDFHNLSFHNEIDPMAFTTSRTDYHMVAVKLETGRQKETIKKLAATYEAFFPASLFDYRFLDDYMAVSYQQEERLSKMTILFSVVSIFISCLGLYGLIAFLAVQRTKEVGIRKLLGASLGSILFIFYKEFILLVIAAFMVAGPVAAFAMNKWLNGFVYHIRLTPWVFVVAVGGTLLIAVLTLSFQSIKAALVNPVDSLRSE